MKKFSALLLVIFFSSLVFSDPVLLHNKGLSFQNDENWYAAIEQYQEALRENPSYQPSFQGLAECFYALSEYEQALDQIIKAQEFKKSDPILMNLHAFILVGLGKTTEASSLFSLVLKTWPNDINARFGAAEIELIAGKTTSASSLYLDALKRFPENRKALLSLALLSQKSGNTVAARDYIRKALEFHGDNPQVFYFAAYVSIMDGQIGEAENRLRNALALRSDYDEARELLSALLFKEKRYPEVIEICDLRIKSDRKHVSAWYIKALTQEKMGNYEAALKSSQTGLQINPEDEVMRAFMEGILIDRLALEDTRRISWSTWHLNKARLYEEKNLSDQALYEYRRALKINPYDIDARQRYAKLLLTRGYPSRYVEQLEFIQSLGKATQPINDAVESYRKLLTQSLPVRWKIDPLYLDKAHTKIGFYFLDDPQNILHPESEKITTAMISEVFSYDQRFFVSSNDKFVASYSEAFRKSREKNEDYFALVQFNENSRDIQITAELYVSRTGSKADQFTVFRTGNDRYSNALRRLVQSISASFPIRGVLIARHQGDAVIDLGKSDGIKKDTKLIVIPSDKVRVANEGISLSYENTDSIGTLTISLVDEDISLGTLQRTVFFDRLQVGDTVLLAPEKEIDTKVPNVEKKSMPDLLSLLRKIR